MLIALLAYLSVSFGFGAIVDLATNPEADWRSLLAGAAYGPIILPMLILERIGVRFR